MMNCFNDGRTPAIILLPTVNVNALQTYSQHAHKHGSDAITRRFCIPITNLLHANVLH